VLRLSGFPEAIEATWPAATVQTCTVHLIRAAMRFVSYQDRKKVAAALRPIYTAPTLDAAESELLAFAESDLGRRYPATVATWENAWERFSPFLAFPPELRRIIYTTNSIVIWSRSRGVLDVVDEAVRSPVLPGGRGYLPGSSTRCPGRFGVRCSGGVARFAA
jgi:hypothetical protein